MAQDFGFKDALGKQADSKSYPTIFLVCLWSQKNVRLEYD